MCNNQDNKSCCIAEILSVINVLQQNAECCGDACLDTCDRGFLGNGTTSLGYNTRPVILYTAAGNGTPWSMPTTREDVVCGDEGVTCSNVFRVEKIDNCCCTFRVLVENEDGTYSSTESFFTMNLECICSIRCLGDTLVQSL